MPDARDPATRAATEGLRSRLASNQPSGDMKAAAYIAAAALLVVVALVAGWIMIL